MTAQGFEQFEMSCDDFLKNRFGFIFVVEMRSLIAVLEHINPSLAIFDNARFESFLDRRSRSSGFDTLKSKYIF